MKVHTAYVAVFDCELACRERMAIGDVKSAYEKALQVGEDSVWPCPRGHWEYRVDGKGGSRDVFVIEDGRHEWVANVMLGKTHMLVAWMEVDRS